MKSTNKLNEYLRVGNAGIYILIAFLVLVIAAVFIWAGAGSLTKTEDVTGIILTDESLDEPVVTVRCTLNAPAYNGVNLLGAKASMRMADGKVCQGTVVSHVQTPVAIGDYAKEFGFSDLPEHCIDWVNMQVVNGSYVYPVRISADIDLREYEYQLADVSIVVAEQHPISFLLY